MAEDFAYNHDFDLAAFLSAPDASSEPAPPLAPRNSTPRRDPDGMGERPAPRSRWLDDVATGRSANAASSGREPRGARELPRLEPPVFEPELPPPPPRRESREAPRRDSSPTPAEDRMRVLREQLAREHAAASPSRDEDARRRLLERPTERAAERPSERRESSLFDVPFFDPPARSEPERREPSRHESSRREPHRHERHAEPPIEPPRDAARSLHREPSRELRREERQAEPAVRSEPPRLAETFSAPMTAPAPPPRRPSSSARISPPPASRDSGAEELDALERKGREAMAAGQLQVAMVCFQRALRVAPLREDLRALLMSTLDDRAMQSPSAPDFLPDRDPLRVEREIDDALRREAEERRRAAMEGAAAPRRAESRWLPAPAVQALVVFRDGLFKWIWRLAMLVVVAAIGFAAWPIGKEFVQNLMIPASQREAVELLTKADAAAKADDYALVRELLERAIDLAPLEEKTEETIAMGLANAYHALGNALYQADKPEEAAELYEKAVKLNAESADLQGDLGMAAMFAANQSYTPSRGNSSLDKYWLARALEAFEAALAVEPENPKWLWRAAECHVKMGNGPLARPLWQKVLEVETDPSSSYAKEARKALLSSGSGGRG